MTEISTTVDVPALTRVASVRPESLSEERRTVDLIWTTGARVLRGYDQRYWEELEVSVAAVRLGRLNNGAPLLDSHDDTSASKVIGVVETAWIENGVGYATVRFARAEDDPEADKIWRKVKDGIIQNVSVGYRTYRSEKTDEAMDGIPVYRATDWEPYELSPVPMGADDGAGVRSATRETNECVLVTRQEKQTMANETETARPPESPAVAATREATVAKIEDAKRIAAEREAAAQEARVAEQTRVDGLFQVAQESRLGEDWARKLIRSGTSVEEARKAAWDLVVRKDNDFQLDGHHRIGAGEDDASKFVRGASAALFECSGVKPLIDEAAKRYPDKFKGVSTEGGEFRGLKLFELARKSLERNGVSTRGMSQMQMCGAAFVHRSGGNYQTAGDFPVLLETTMNKILLAAYALQSDTWSRFCRADTVADFRAAGRYRAGSLTALDAVTEHGEFKNKAVPDGQKISIGLQTYGNIVGLSRQTIINDDLGALTDMAVKLGRASKLTIENAVYALINANSGLGPTQGDSQPFFHSNRANVNATGSALAAAGIDADRVVMGAQKDVNNVDYIDLRPEILLVPASLAATARVLNGAPYDPIANKFQTPNPVQGLFRDIVDSPRLSGTRRYLLADPAIAPVIVVAFLQGQGQAPTVDAENGWRIDGVEWKVRLDAKAQMFDPKGGVTNAGA